MSFCPALPGQAVRPAAWRARTRSPAGVTPRLRAILSERMFTPPLSSSCVPSAAPEMVGLMRCAREAEILELLGNVRQAVASLERADAPRCASGREPVAPPLRKPAGTDFFFKRGLPHAFDLPNVRHDIIPRQYVGEGAFREPLGPEVCVGKFGAGHGRLQVDGSHLIAVYLPRQEQ